MYLTWPGQYGMNDEEPISPKFLEDVLTMLSDDYSKLEIESILQAAQRCYVECGWYEIDCMQENDE